MSFDPHRGGEQDACSPHPNSLSSDPNLYSSASHQDVPSYLHSGFDELARAADQAGGSTPLDLLLNAISGSSGSVNTDDPIVALEQPGRSSGGLEIDAGISNRVGEGVNSEIASYNLEYGDKPGQSSSSSLIFLSESKRALQEDGTSPQRAKIAKTISSHLSTASPTPLVSKIQVWHPRTAQKSYGKERRLLYPPPRLSVTGPLLHVITRAKLSSYLASSDPSSSQTHNIPLSTCLKTTEDSPLFLGHEDQEIEEDFNTVAASEKAGAPSKSRSKAKHSAQRAAAGKAGWGTTLAWIRNKVVAKERVELKEGLMFPGLYVLEDGSKSKEFRIELELGIPVSESSHLNPETKIQGDPDCSKEVSQEAQVSLNALETTDKDITDIVHAAHSKIVDTGMNTDTTDNSTLSSVFNSAAMEIELDDRLLDYIPEVDVHKNHPQSLDAIQPSTSIVSSSAVSTNPAPNGQLTSTPIGEANIAGNENVTTQSVETKPWVTLSSTFLTTVSKPSQKTAKARSLETGLTCKDTFALWSRVHGQTVRTKFLHSTHRDADSSEKVIGGATFNQSNLSSSTRLEARTGKWTPFRFEIISRPPRPTYDEKRGTTMPGRVRGDDPNVITYGSIVKLVDVQTGAKSDPVKIVRVDRNEAVVRARPSVIPIGENSQISQGASNGVVGDEGHPVSELQRIGLVRLTSEGQVDESGGSRWYLSAPGATVGAGEVKKTRAKPSPTIVAASGSATTLEAQAGEIGDEVSNRGMVGQLGSTEKEAEQGQRTLITERLDLKDEESLAVQRSSVVPETLSGVPTSSTNLNLTNELTDNVPSQTNDPSWINVDSSLPLSGKEPETDVKVNDANTTNISATQGKRRGNIGKHTLKTKRHALARAVVAEEEEGSTQSELRWVPASRRENDTNLIVEDVDDWMCWYIGGVMSFSVTLLNSTSDELPTNPIGRLPRLYVEPSLDLGSMTLEFTLSTFHSLITSGTGERQARAERFEVYLGPLGPLQVSFFRSTAPKVAHGHVPYPAVLVCDDEEVDVRGGYMVNQGGVEHGVRGRHRGGSGENVVGVSGRVMSAFPSFEPHAIVRANMPRIEEILQAMHELAVTNSANNDPSSAKVEREVKIASKSDMNLPGPSASQSEAQMQAEAEAESWLIGDLTAHTELTIQDAIRNAAEQQSEMDLVGEGLDSEKRSGITFNEGETMIDPELRELKSVDQANADPAAAMVGNATSSSVPSALTMRVPEERGKKGVGLQVVPLPILLVRSDGLALGLGWSVVAERREAEGDMPSHGQWELKVMNDLKV